jgi:hypothetical protein
MCFTILFCRKTLTFSLKRIRVAAEMNKKNKEQEMEELKKACVLVENICRSLGRDCTVVFHRDGVSVAPPEWAGDSTGDTLFEALEDALINS